MMFPRSPRPSSPPSLDDVLGAAGVHERHHAELGRLGPERVELRQRQILAVDVSADRGGAQAQTLDAILELLRGEVGELQRARRHGHEPVRILRDELRQPLVLRPDDPIREVPVLDLVPPEPVDAERLDVDALLVDQRDAVRAERPAPALLRPFRALDDGIDLGHGRVRMDVDDAHAAAADRSPAAAPAGACAAPVSLRPRGRRLPPQLRRRS